MSRIVCQFSCGAASAVATKLALAEYGDRVVIVNAFIHEEHADNRRFLADCERWFGQPVTVLMDEKWGASTHEIWRRKSYIIGRRVTPCSVHLKRDLLDRFRLPGDSVVVGFTADELDRFENLQDSLTDYEIIAPLIEKGLTKSDCLAMVERAGLVLPEMYRKGYDNANCIGCPKGGQNYWQAIREDFPEQFIQIKTIQEEIGPGANFLRFRSGPRKNERMSLADLPAGRGNMADEPSFSCSFFCELAEQDMSTQPAASHEVTK